MRAHTHIVNIESFWSGSCHCSWLPLELELDSKTLLMKTPHSLDAEQRNQAVTGPRVSLLAGFPSAWRCLQAAWKNRVLTLRWTLPATTPTYKLRCAHWYSNSTICGEGISNHFLFGSKAYSTRENSCLSETIKLVKSPWLRKLQARGDNLHCFSKWTWC